MFSPFLRTIGWDAQYMMWKEKFLKDELMKVEVRFNKREKKRKMKEEMEKKKEMKKLSKGRKK